MLRCPDNIHFPPIVRSVAFVCTGNICRSPMAEALLRSMLTPDIKLKITSCGTLARQGNSATEGTVAAAAEAGLDLVRHSARRISADVLRATDLILTMELQHRDEIFLLAPEAMGKVFSLGCFSRENPSPGREIPDPYGGTLDAYRRSLDEIAACIDNLFVFLRPRLVRL